MPANFRVALVLDDETNKIWNGLPRGERSQRIRAALKIAEIVYEKDVKADAQSKLIFSLRTDNKSLRMSIDQARHFPCGICRCECVIGYIDKDGNRVVGEVIE